mgnify:CR=1 FL=1
MRTSQILRPHGVLFYVATVFLLGLSGCSDESSQTLLTQARASIQAGDRNAAVIQLKSAIQKDEQNADARFELAKLQMQLGDYAAAEKELRRAREYGLAGDKVNPLLAQVLIRLGEFQRVLDEIPSPSAGSPNESTLLVARANAQLSLKQPEEARKELDRATNIAPNDPDVHLALARLALADRKPPEAFNHLEIALKSSPEHLEAWLFKGDLLRATGKLAEAETAYQAALKIDPEHFGARLALAEIALSQNRLADARKQVDYVLGKAPNNLLGRYTQAQIDYREKKYTEARDHLAGVIKTAPGYLPAMLLHGANEYALGNLQTAEAYLNKVVKAAPNNVYAIKFLAASQLKLDRADDAYRTIAPALRIAPQDLGVRIVAGEIALAKKALAEATGHFEAAAKINPDSAEIRTQLGLSRLVQGDSRAMAELQSASTMAKGDNRADTLIILTHLKNKQYDAALSAITALEKKHGVSPSSWNYRGAVYLGKKDMAQARASFEQALKLDPVFFPAAANLARLDVLDKKPDQARKRFEAILQQQPAHLNAMLTLADVALSNKDEKAYIAWLDKAAASNPTEMQPRLLKSRYLMSKGQHAKALALAREVVNAQPKNPDALDLLGMAQFASKDYENAHGTYQKLAELYPKQAQPKLKLAQVLIAMKRTDDARKTLQEILKLKSDLIEAQLLLGSLEIQTARYEDAQIIAKQIQKQPAALVAGLILEGDTAMARKQYLAAISVYERAYKLSSSPVTLIRLHQALAGAGRLEEGDKHVSAWLVSHPQDNGTRLFLAEHLTTSRQYKAAADHYLLLNQNIPGNLVVLNNLAFTLSELKDKRALSFAEQAHKLKPDNPAVMDTLGWLLVQEGQSQRGIKLLQQALSKAPDAAEIQYHLAAAYIKVGDRARAQSELERLLASGMTFPQEQEARVLLSQLQGKTR